MNVILKHTSHGDIEVSEIETNQPKIIGNNKLILAKHRNEKGLCDELWIVDKKTNECVFVIDLNNLLQ